MPPIQKPGKSRQDYQTPPEFLQALKNRLGILNFGLDIAASPENAVCLEYITEEMNALDESQVWCSDGWAFCNPPYANITPWVRKAFEESRHPLTQIAMLVPASVGANWWLNHVHNKAYVYFLNGRLTFIGETTPYPKDCAILLYASFLQGGYKVWDWRGRTIKGV